MSDPYNPRPPFRRGSDYGMRIDPFTGKAKPHTGQDFKAPLGTPIPAATPGEVVYSGYNNNLGHTVIVKNAAGYSLYAHMQEGSPMPKLGQRVWPGDIIGNVGSTGARSTGPHLHYSVIKNERATQALEKKRAGGPLGLILTGDTAQGQGNTIDPARYDTGVPYLVRGAVTGASGSVAPSAPLRGLGFPSRDGVVADRSGAWMSLPGHPATDQSATVPRPGGLPGMIADYLRQSHGTAGDARATGLSAVPFVTEEEPLSEGRPANFKDRFGDWSAIRRLSSHWESR